MSRSTSRASPTRSPSRSGISPPSSDHRPEPVASCRCCSALISPASHGSRTSPAPAPSRRRQHWIGQERVPLLSAFFTVGASSRDRGNRAHRRQGTGLRAVRWTAASTPAARQLRRIRPRSPRRALPPRARQASRNPCRSGRAEHPRLLHPARRDRPLADRHRHRRVLESPGRRQATGSQLEDTIQLYAEIMRSFGIYLVVATQRPSATSSRATSRQTSRPVAHSGFPRTATR